MAYLLASILSSTVILVLFRWMQNSAASTRHAIVINYLAAAIAGSVLFKIDWSFASDGGFRQGWFWLIALEGVAFYLVFRLIALTTQRTGITIAGIATKMSVVIPTLIGIIALGESVSVFKIGGLLCGIFAVLLAVGWRFGKAPQTEGSQLTGYSWLLPILAFVGTGCIDASFKLFQVWGLTDSQFPGFIVTVFGFAFITAGIHHVLLPDKAINTVSAAFGVALGLANLGTLYFILKALAVPGWESSIVFPLNNFGIVLASTVSAIMLFKERLTTATKLSLCFAIASIVLLFFASY